jgi:AcrR family transcriptional regulator
VASPGLRERKKARTRRHIADTAARLFAERGYENVAVTDVAREPEVAEQTVYNYFPAKEQLVTDREEQVEGRLCELIGSRPAGTTPAAAVRDFVLTADPAAPGWQGLWSQAPQEGQRVDRQCGDGQPADRDHLTGVVGHADSHRRDNDDGRYPRDGQAPDYRAQVHGNPGRKRFHLTWFRYVGLRMRAI